MVDSERVARLLDRVAQDIKSLRQYRDDADITADLTVLAAVKYLFITGIEGCARVAQHIVAAEGWPVPETNADAVRRLAAEYVIDSTTGEAVAKAIGFRNVLVHEYTDINDDYVVTNLQHLSDLETYVGQVARWVQAR